MQETKSLTDDELDEQIKDLQEEKSQRYSKYRGKIFAGVMIVLFVIIAYGYVNWT